MRHFMHDRRGFLALAGGTALATGLAGFPAGGVAQPARQTLTAATRIIEVNGKAAKVFGLLNAAGTSGLVVDRQDGFNVALTNRTDAETIIHWHGLTPPFALDGNPLSQAPVAPGETMDFTFDLARGGTNWMHSHLGLQEAQLMAAPLIVRDGPARMQEVTVLLHDFSFTPPEEIFATLKGEGANMIGSGMAGMDHSGMDMSGGSGMGMDMGNMNMATMDINDIAFDAYLANDRTLADPEVIAVDKGTTVLLRIINAAASTNFHIDLGAVSGTVVAVDGMPVQPLTGTMFELAMAQRIDIEVTLPADGSALPVLAQREGDTARTGVILAPRGATIAKIAEAAETRSGSVLLDLESRLRASAPLSERAPTRQIMGMLTGSMQSYVWGIDGRPFEGRAPLDVTLGDRVEMMLHNMTMMSHPMHLHGHHFQVVAVNGQTIAGAIRDTVLVPAMGSVTIRFDADNPGEWPLHCHNLYHMAAGMMTTLRYV